jgi:hypothetical protein
MSDTAPTLADALAAERDRVIDALSDDAVTAFATTDPAFKSGGFRPGNAAPIRMRLRVLAAAADGLSDTLRRLLAHGSLNRTLIADLSESAIADLRHDLAALFGPARILLALQLDDRQTLREAAARWLSANPPFAPVEPAAATARLRDVFGRLLDACGVAGAAPGAPLIPTREAWQDEKAHLNDQLRDLRAQLRALKDSDARAIRFQKLADALTAERDDRNARLDAETAEKRLAIRQRGDLEAELGRERTQREERLRAALDSRLASEFAGWIAHARAVEAEAAADDAAHRDALEQTEHALRRQAAADRHSGNRATLLARLGALDAARARARDALAHALVQTPELPAAVRSLDDEIQRVRAILQIEEPVSALEETLAARLHAADGNTLYAIRTLTERLAAFAVLDPAALHRIDAAINRRQAALLSRGEMPEGKAPEPVLALRRALTGRGKAMLLIDGHNLLFALQGRYMPPSGAAVPDREKRARMIADLVRVVGPHPSCRVWIVFDGPVSSEETPAPNVRVSYSGGVGEHRADAVLLDDIRFLRGVDAEIPVILASNDNALCGQARRIGAVTIAATDIGALL